MTLDGVSWTSFQSDTFMKYTLVNFRDFLNIHCNRGKLLHASLAQPPTSFFRDLSLQTGRPESDVQEYFAQRGFAICRFILTCKFLDQTEAVSHSLELIKDNGLSNNSFSFTKLQPSTAQKSTQSLDDGEVFFTESSQLNEPDPVYLPSLSNFSGQTPRFLPRSGVQAKKISKRSSKKSPPTSPLIELENFIATTPEWQEAFRPYILHLKCSLIMQ